MEDDDLEVILEFLNEYRIYLKKDGEPTIEVDEVIESIELILYP